MSICRLSSDGYQSNVYCYLREEGWVIHVARCRFVSATPRPELSREASDKVAAWCRHQLAMAEWVRNADTVSIGLPHDGETFIEPSAHEAIERLSSLRALGYFVPESAFVALRRELPAEPAEWRDALRGD